MSQRWSFPCSALAVIFLLQAFPARSEEAVGGPPPMPSFSLDPPKPIPPGEDQIVGLKKGEGAPFSGQLFDAPTALRWGNYLEQYRVLRRADAELYTVTLKAHRAYYEGVLVAEREKYKVVTTDLSTRLAKAEWDRDHPPWWRSGWFTFALGVVVTGSAIGLGAYLAK